MESGGPAGSCDLQPSERDPGRDPGLPAPPTKETCVEAVEEEAAAAVGLGSGGRREWMVDGHGRVGVGPGRGIPYYSLGSQGPRKRPH